MRQAIDFIKEGQVIEGTFKMGKEKYNLGVQPDGSVLFKEGKHIYRGYMFMRGYAVALVK